MSDPSVAFPGIGLVASSAPLPSDYTPMILFLAAVQIVATIAALVGASIAARNVKSPTLRSFVRLSPLAVSLSFAQFGTSRYWWPALWGLLLGPLEEKVKALAVIAAFTLALFVLCALFHRLARAAA